MINKAEQVDEERKMIRLFDKSTNRTVYFLMSLSKIKELEREGKLWDFHSTE